MILAVPQSLKEAFTLFIRGVQRVVGTQGAYQAQVTGQAMALALVELVSLRLSALGRQFNRMVDQLRDGTLPQPRVLRPDAPARAGSPRPGASPPANPFPTGFGWLRRRVTLDLHHLNHWASQLERLLAEPDMQAMIAAAPRRMAGVLRPLGWMLGIKLDGVLPPRPKRGRSSRRKEAAAPTASGNAVAVRAPGPHLGQNGRAPQAAASAAALPCPTFLQLPDGQLLDLRSFGTEARHEFIRTALAFKPA